MPEQAPGPPPDLEQPGASGAQQHQPAPTTAGQPHGRSRQRRTRQRSGPQDAGGSFSGQPGAQHAQNTVQRPPRQRGQRQAPTGVAGAFPPAAPPAPAGALTWQQQGLLSAAAQPFEPEAGEGPQQQAGAPSGRRRRRGQGRQAGRGPAAAIEPAGAPEQQETLSFASYDGQAAQQQEHEQQQQQRQPRTRPRKPRPPRPPAEAGADGLAAAGPPPLEGGGGADYAYASLEQQQQVHYHPDLELLYGQQQAPAQPPAAAPRHRQPPARLERPQRQPAQPQGAREQRQNEAGEAPLGADAAAEDAPHCLVCCDPLVEVALGRCNHGQACSSCTLRMRLCYGNRDCPFCKQQLDEVLIAPWRPDLPEWEWYEAHPEAVARSRCFAGGTILANRWRPGGRLSSRLLHDLERRTSPACSVCDPGAQAPFPTVPQLARHMRDDHGQRMCNLCLEEGRLFPLEQPVFPSAEALAAHAAERHPRCDFCARRFYGDDELWRHMQQAHYSCHVCPPPAAAFAYFRGPRELIAHLAQEHYACQEPECADCFVAFATQDELRRHHLERHSVRMPRWDASRARPLPLDIQFVRRPAAAGPDAGGAGGGRGGRGARRTRASQDVRMHDGGGGRGDEGGGEGGGEEAAPGSRWEFDREIEGGLAVIDDQAFPAAAAGRGAGADWQPLAGGSWAGRAPPRAAAGGGEEFPSLATAAAVAAAAAGGAVAGGGGGGEAGGGGRRQPPPLLKMVSRCPCGRRTARYALEEGQQPPPLECDGVCQLEGRRAQLADAFGVEHPESHVPSFGRRGASYSGLLLAAAQQQPKLVEALEKALGAFLADRSSQRHTLPPAPREARAVAHALAEQYGLASRGVGQEPARGTELIKTPDAGVPRRLLSRVAATVPAEEVAALLREAAGHPMRLDSVAPSVDLRYYLRRWEGGYALEWESSEAAVVRFARAEDLKDCLDSLGGGIRGLFRVDRSWQPRTAVRPGAAASGRSGCGWGGAAAGVDGASSASSTWTSVALALPAPAAPPAQQQAAAEEEAGPAVRSGWAVIGSKRATRAPAPMASSSSVQQRQGLAGLLPDEEESGGHDDGW